MDKILLKYKYKGQRIEVVFDEETCILCCRSSSRTFFSEKFFLLSELHPVFLKDQGEKQRKLPEILGYIIAVIFGGIALVLFSNVFSVQDKIPVIVTAIFSALISVAGWGYASQFSHRTKAVYFYSLWRNNVVLYLPFTGKSRKIVLQGAEKIRDLLLNYTKIPAGNIDLLDLQNLYNRNLINDDEFKSYISWYALPVETSSKISLTGNMNHEEGKS